jgi:hypothetical protein
MSSAREPLTEGSRTTSTKTFDAHDFVFCFYSFSQNTGLASLQLATAAPSPVVAFTCSFFSGAIEGIKA